MKKVWFLVLFAALFVACSSDNGGGDNGSDNVDPAPVSFERGAMLENWADNIIIPSYESFTAELSALKAAFETFKTDSNEANLTALRASWLSAYKTWQHVSLFEIGPAETVGLRLNVNIYPVDAEKIDGFVQSGSYDLTLSSNRDAKGFPALDYLINGLGENDTAIVSKFSTTEKDGLISYIDVVLNDMETLITQVISQWKAGYRDTFVNNDGASSTASVDRFVNDFILYYEKYLRAGKMGIPLGVFSGEVLPRNVEAYYKADVSNELFLEGLAGVQNFFNGNHFQKASSGESLASYLEALNTLKGGEDLAELINGQLNAARTRVEALGSFRSEIENNAPPTNMLKAYDEVQRAVPLLKVDMVSAMNISIDFVDADGD
ncbi:imelysin family protein [Pseudozobellia sp. WGM2]|uniref:imelysin family protein n=1 Tax=Pseudozobellia sp. WGM2 TaxID=2787625 RepID=UPI001ADF43FF|nr:imelysin family protein [Pseudozobellia sp. WGM2]